MAHSRFSDEEFIACWRRLGSPAAVSRALDVGVRNVMGRRARIEERYGIILDVIEGGKRHPSRPKLPKRGLKAIAENINGTVIVFSDMHVWPGQHKTPAFEALKTLIAELRPRMVIANGDSLDAASISRHPPIGWEQTPSVLDELGAVKEAHAEIEAVTPDETDLVYVYGNHCLRFDTRLAMAASEFRGIEGFSLADHLPAWDFTMLVELNAGLASHTVIKHNYHGGQHAAFNNAVKSGVNIVTGHTHRLQTVHWGDYRSFRFGIECGTLCDFQSESPQFAYALGNPLNWSQGFSVLTYQDGVLLEPEFCRVINGIAYFRGQSVSNKVMPQTAAKRKAA